MVFHHTCTRLSVDALYKISMMLICSYTVFPCRDVTSSVIHCMYNINKNAGLYYMKLFCMVIFYDYSCQPISVESTACIDTYIMDVGVQHLMHAFLIVYS